MYKENGKDKNPALLILILALALLCACHTKPAPRQTGPVRAADLNLIRLCIDSTLSLDPAVNEDTYLIDFGVLQYGYRATADSFLRLNPAVQEVNLHSLLEQDESWNKNGFLQIPVIAFNSITLLPDKTIEVHTSKTKAVQASLGTRIVLKQQDTGFICLSCRITWIS